MNSEQYLCIHIERFSLQSLVRCQTDLRTQAVAVMQGEVPFQYVCSVNNYALNLGVIEGMSRAEMDSFPAVLLLKRSIAEEHAAQLSVFECAGKYSPRIELLLVADSLNCILDIAGTERLFGSPDTMAMKINDDLVASGFYCSIAVSSNFNVAVCMARGTISQKPVIVPTGYERQSLAELPLTVLDISPEYAETFSQWGISNLGMLAMLPETDIISRLGQEGKRFIELSRGIHPHLFQPLEPRTSFAEYIELDTPTDVIDSLLFCLGLLLEKIIMRANASILSLATITAELGMESGRLHTRVVRSTVPSNEKQLWIKLLHLDWIAHPPQSAVVSLQLRAETGSIGKVQLGLFSPQLPEPVRLDVTLARIRAVVGEDRVGSIELKDSHEPDSFRIKPFSVAYSGLDNIKRDPATPHIAMRCLRPAETILVTLRSHRPYIFHFRGSTYKVENAYGPWRSTGGWWSDGRWSLEEWDVIARTEYKSMSDKSGSFLCCCMTREPNTGRWQIEALYD